jgi:hypothetical protein
MRKQFFKSAGGLSWETLEDVFEIAVRIMSVELRGLDEAHDGSGTLTGAQGPSEEPVGSIMHGHA